MSQTLAEKQTMLDNVNAAINGLLTGGVVQSYSIKGRSINKIPLADLLKMRDQLESEINAASGGATAYAAFESPS